MRILAAALMALSIACGSHTPTETDASTTSAGGASPSDGALAAGGTGGNAGQAPDGSGNAGGTNGGGGPNDADVGDAAVDDGPIVGTRLSYRIADAEYSRALQRIVALSVDSPELHLLDPATGLDVAIALPVAGIAVSVSPDGLSSAVAHDGSMTLVDLNGQRLERTWPVRAPKVGDIVLAGNRYAYVFTQSSPLDATWETIRSVNIDTGVEAPYNGERIFVPSLAKLHPDGVSIYSAANGISPTHVAKNDISRGGATFVAKASATEALGDLWISDDGSRIFTRGGAVLTASSDSALDLKPVRTLDLKRLASAYPGMAHLADVPRRGKVAAIVGECIDGYGRGTRKATEIRIFNADLNLESTIPVQSLGPSRKPFSPSECYFIFADATGENAAVICGDGPKPGTVNGVFSLSL